MKCYAVALFLIMVLEASECESQDPLQEVPQWHEPCGSTGHQHIHKIIHNKKTWGRQLVRSLRKIRKQLNITMEHFKNQNFRNKYKQVVMGIDDNQYILNWVPGMGNVLMLFSGRLSRLQVSSYLPNLHIELQRFGIALEAIIHNSSIPNDKTMVSVIDTNMYLIQFLCEVEEALIALQIAVPAPREKRSIMTNEERAPPDETRCLIRDWGILLKYRDYLRYWNELLSKMEKNHTKRKSQKKNP